VVRAPRADIHSVPARSETGDAFCRIVRCQVGRGQVEALASAPGGRDRSHRRALEQAVMTSAWSTAMPGEPASEWLRVVQPIEPALEEIAPERPLLVLVAGLRRVVARDAEAGDEAARMRLAAAREEFGGTDRGLIMGILARAEFRSQGEPPPGR
jgi:hypothetical protein